MKTIFNEPYEGWSPCIISDKKNATRNTQPVMTEEPNIEPTFKQETHNPSVRDRVYPEGPALTEQFYADLVLQLNAAQKTAVYFEREAAELHVAVDRITKRYAERVSENTTLRLSNERLKAGGFWKRAWRTLVGDDTLYT